MKANFHTHSSFCDGKNTPEEIVLAAIEKGFFSLGFSGHGYTPFDLRYCMKDTEGYIAEIERLREKYRNDIQIYVGVEEDAFSPVDRSRFDYVIGSSHYFLVDGKYMPIDSGYDYFKECLKAFNYDAVAMAHAYYGAFCGYINSRRPDIVGHFDLITKFDELDASLFLSNAEYNKIAEAYVAEAAKSGCVFEVNTGAIARGLRTSPYPNENLLRALVRGGARLTLSSDSHAADTLDFGFDEAKSYLRDLGVKRVYALLNRELVGFEI